MLLSPRERVDQSHLAPRPAECMQSAYVAREFDMSCFPRVGWQVGTSLVRYLCRSPQPLPKPKWRTKPGGRIYRRPNNTNPTEVRNPPASKRNLHQTAAVSPLIEMKETGHPDPAISSR